MQDRGRTQILLTGKLCLEGEWHPFRVKDISARGVKGHGIRNLNTGAEVRVCIRGSEPMAGRIVWSDEMLFELQFDVAINPRRFRTVITGSYDPPKKPDEPPPVKRPV